MLLQKPLNRRYVPTFGQTSVVVIIDNVYISDEVMEEQFVCNLSKCKGGCCVEGDAGAPLTQQEMEEVKNAFEKAAPLLTAEGRSVVQQQGFYTYDQEFGWVTPTISNGMCAYGLVDAQGVVKCSFEQLYNEGKTSWKKPISCHLFPIKITQSKTADQEYLNYEPRPELCAPACKLGQELKVPVYKFLKEALIRKYGEEFYSAMEEIGAQYFNDKSGQ